MGAQTEHAAGWSNERVAKLRQLWDDGYTAAAIADELGGGVTRSSVCGKVKRLNLAPRKGTGRAHGEPREPRERRKPRVRVPRHVYVKTEPVAVIEAIPPLLVSLMDLTEHTCRYPVGDPWDHAFGFCGHSTKDGSPYCEAHHKACYAGFGKVQPTERRLSPEIARESWDNPVRGLEVVGTNSKHGCVAAGKTSCKSTPLATSTSPSV